MTSCFPVIDIVFGIDSSSDVTREEFEIQIEFVQSLEERLKINSSALIAYGGSAKTLIQPYECFSDRCAELRRTRITFSSKGRRMDEALTETKEHFSSQNGAGCVKQRRRIRTGCENSRSTQILAQIVRFYGQTKHEDREKVLVLLTYGQQAGENVEMETSGVLSSAAKSLQEENVKIIVIAVGDGVCFTELVNLIERPHHLFWLLSISDQKKVAETIAEEIEKTSGEETFRINEIQSNLYKTEPC